MNDTLSNGQIKRRLEKHCPTLASILKSKKSLNAFIRNMLDPKRCMSFDMIKDNERVSAFLKNKSAWVYLSNRKHATEFQTSTFVIGYAFVWEKSKEGNDFWCDIWMKIKDTTIN